MTTAERKYKLQDGELYDLKCVRGQTWSVTLTFKDVNKVVMNITGYTSTMTIKDKFGGTTLATLTGTISGAAGTATFAMAKTVTSALTFNNAVYTIMTTTPPSASADVPTLRGNFIMLEV
jgi:hypothetical protein